MPQLMADASLGGVAGKPPGGAGGNSLAGISVMLMNRGAVATLPVPGTFETWPRTEVLAYPNAGTAEIAKQKMYVACASFNISPPVSP